MIKLIQIGLGPLGQKIVRFIAARKNIEIVAAIEIDPDKVGKDLGKLCSLHSMGVLVSNDLVFELKDKNPDVAIISTASSLSKVKIQIEEIAKKGVNIISTCEEMAYPWKTQFQLAKQIDEICKKHNVVCVGTGVNPGFLMDYLPCVLSTACQKVEKVTVSRFQDASNRRIPFQRKIGAGLTIEQFREKEKQGVLRHLGLVESINMIAKCMGWKLDNITENLNPIIAEQKIITDNITIDKAYASGVEQIGKGFVGNKEVICLNFRASIGEKNPVDRIEISGIPNIKSEIQGGINGDIATCSITINTIKSILSASPGLKTMLDLPNTGFFF